MKNPGESVTGPRTESRKIHVDVGLLARSQYSEGSATGHLDTGFSWFPCV